MLLYPITKCACAVKPFVEESQAQEKAPRGNAGQKGKLLNRRGDSNPPGQPDASTQRPWDAVTRRKLAFRELVGEKAANWTDSDDRAWHELKASELAAGKLSPSVKEKSIRGRFIVEFNAASTNEQRRQLLRGFLDQHFDSAITWPWFKERCDGLAMAGLPLYAPTQVMTPAAAPTQATPAQDKAADAAKNEPDRGAQKPITALTQRERGIHEVIRRGSKGLTYCRELDAAGISPRREGSWKGSAATYRAAFLDGGRWPHRIEDEKSRIKRKAIKLAKTRRELADE